MAGDRDGALSDAAHAMELDPKSGLGRLARARVQKARGDLADAQAAALLELRPRDAAAARDNIVHEMPAFGYAPRR